MLTITRNDAGFQPGKHTILVQWHSLREKMPFCLVHAQNQACETIQTILLELEDQKLEIVLFQREKHYEDDGPYFFQNLV